MHTVHTIRDASKTVIFRTFTELSSVSDLQHKCRELCEGLAHDMEHHLIKVISVPQCVMARVDKLPLWSFHESFK